MKETFNIIDGNVRKNCLNRILSKHGKFTVKILPLEDKRSLNQNNLMWAWLGILADWNGDTAYDWHDRMRETYGLYDVNEKDGKQYMKLKSSTRFTVKQMTAYLNAIEMEMMKHGLNYPDPSYYGLEMRSSAPTSPVSTQDSSFEGRKQ